MKDLSFRLPGSREKGVLLIHGLTGSPPEMKPVGKHLSRAGFTCYAPTLAGHCQDMAALTATTYEDWVDSMKTALNEFKKEVDEVYIAGICVGGHIGLMLAHDMPQDVKGVAVYSAALNYDGWNVPFYYPWAGWGIPLLAHLPYFKNIGFPETSPFGMKNERIRNSLVSGGMEGALPVFPTAGLYQQNRMTKKMMQVLPEIKTPTLLVHATDDDVAHPRNAERIKACHGGKCEIAMLDDCYHLIHIDQERKKVADLTAEFFGVKVADTAPEVFEEAA